MPKKMCCMGARNEMYVGAHEMRPKRSGRIFIRPYENFIINFGLKPQNGVHYRTLTLWFTARGQERFVVRHEALAKCREKQKRHSTSVSWLTTNKEQKRLIVSAEENVLHGCTK